eukprot:1160724-Pelagomonas_calceolata.AAC.5
MMGQRVGGSTQMHSWAGRWAHSVAEIADGAQTAQTHAQALATVFLKLHMVLRLRKPMLRL